MNAESNIPYTPSRIFTYTQYRQLLDELMAENKTTGSNQEADIIDYAKLNIHRMRRLDKTVTLNAELTEALQKTRGNYQWLLITEGWCGDAAQIVPVLALMAQTNPAIDLQVILRDENTDIMDKYLTNGGRAIPKLVCFNAAGEELWHWGPRPAPAQLLVTELKKQFPDSWKEQADKLHKWYADDKTQAIQQELTVKIRGML